MLDSDKTKKKQKLRNCEYYNMTDIFDNLYAKSLNGNIFTRLMGIISSQDNILLSYRNIKKNKGSKTAGVDNRTIDDLEKLSINELVVMVRRKLTNYTPKPSKRVEIPKANGKMRPLGIPCIMDRIVQQCILQVLEPICEAKFHERNNGFRPNRSTEHAISQCYKMIQCYNLNYVVDIDIEGFFDNVNHKKLKQQLWTLGIQDKRLICVITEMLKAPIKMPNGDTIFPTKGTPQGGILSPLLSNIVLNELDWWITSQWENMKSQIDYSCNSSKYRALRRSNLKEVYIVRYADDFKLFCRNINDAKKIFIATEKWLYKRLTLKISHEKSKIVSLRESYSEFLGFKIKTVRKGNKYVVTSHISDKAQKIITNTLRDKIKNLQKPRGTHYLKNDINLYNSYVWGIHNYYRYATRITADCGNINFLISKTLKNRFKHRLQKKGEIKIRYIKEKYGHSSQLRFVDGHAISPIGYIKNKIPIYKKKIINNYTSQGRNEIHKSLGIDMTIIYQLMSRSENEENIELADNMISLYCAQYGKCAITGIHLELYEISCHHKTPKNQGGGDKYKNLIIVHKDVHRLLHAVETEVINKYLNIIENSKSMLTKINVIRKKAKLETIKVL
jgi:RNA-directed DNA polymerase